MPGEVGVETAVEVGLVGDVAHLVTSVSQPLIVKIHL
jgi:hypothetical protein